MNSGVPATTPVAVSDASPTARARLADREPGPAGPLFQENVRGLDVAMNQALGVRRRQPLRHLGADADDVRERQSPVPVQPVRQRFAGDVLHDQERYPVRLIDRMNGHDAVVLEGGGGPCLAKEPATGLVAGEGQGREHLDRHRPPQRGVETLENQAHAAAADLAPDFVGAEPAHEARPVRRLQEGIRPWW
jgi:hypothetical protein